MELILLGTATLIVLPLIVQPRSWLFTMLFTLVELNVLAAYRDGAPARRLILVPLVIVIWANTHIQFIYGIALVAFALVDAVIARVFPGRFTTQAKAGPLALCAAASVVAPLINPYGVGLLHPLLDAVRLSDPFLYISELKSLSFRDAGHWFALALSFAAVFSLGRRRTIEPLPLLVFLFGCAVGFRAQRDVWVLTIGACWVLSSFVPARVGASFAWTWPRATVFAVVMLSTVALFAKYGTSNVRLEQSVARTFPAAAAAVVEQRRYPGPVFNTYDWGGYILWRLPALNVSMDGRNTFYGDTRVWRSIRTWSGVEGWDADPELAASRLVIAPRSAALTSLLRLDRRFAIAYEDDVAVVFIK
jgi:hypothetical protein